MLDWRPEDTWQDAVGRFKDRRAPGADANLDGPSQRCGGLDTGCRAAMGLCGLDVLQVPQEASPGTRTAIGPCQVGLGKAPGCTVLAPRHGGTEEQAPGLRGSQAGRGDARSVDTPPVSLSAVSHPTSGMFSGTHKAINNLKS